MAAILIPNTRYKGPAEGFCDSLTASLKGLFIGAVLTALCMAFQLDLLFVRLGSLTGLDSGLVGLGLLLVFSNYCFLSNFVSAITRDTSPTPTRPQSEEPESTPPESHVTGSEPDQAPAASEENPPATTPARPE